MDDAEAAAGGDILVVAPVASFSHGAFSLGICDLALGRTKLRLNLERRGLSDVSFRS